MTFASRATFLSVVVGLTSSVVFECPARGDEAAPGPLNIVSVASPYRISERARSGTIQYDVSLPHGTPWQWPETSEQHAVIDGNKVELTVCKSCGQEAAPSKAELLRYVQSNPWVDGADATLMHFARSARGGTVDAVMQKLVTAVQAHMTGAIDYRGYNAARVAYETRTGDCTEFAVLLAAVARARGIPTRVVAGLAYSSRFAGKPHTFAPHMWVQAWDGQRWASYDAGLGHFDAGHIAIAIGDGTPRSLDGAMAVIRHLTIDEAASVVD